MVQIWWCQKWPKWSRIFFGRERNDNWYLETISYFGDPSLKCLKKNFKGGGGFFLSFSTLWGGGGGVYIPKKFMSKNTILYTDIIKASSSHDTYTFGPPEDTIKTPSKYPSHTFPTASSYLSETNLDPSDTNQTLGLTIYSLWICSTLDWRVNLLHYWVWNLQRSKIILRF